MTRVEIITKALTAMKDGCNYSLTVLNYCGNYVNGESEKKEYEDTIIKIDEMLKDLALLGNMNLSSEIKNGAIS